jgi:acetoin utilization deacetylase AcuC-like enzyme
MLPASLEDIREVHGLEDIELVQYNGFYDVEDLAAAGAICAAELAPQGDSTFALVRPPGHHASANPAWGNVFL